jgi:hypothetical protein
MIDPLTCFTAATAAYSMLRKTIHGAQDVSDTLGVLTTWYESCSDLTKAAEQRANPTMIERMTHGSQSIEAEALDIVIRRKSLAEKEKEIALLLNLRFGPLTYQELLDTRRSIRKEREAKVHAAMENKREILNNMAICTLSFGILGIVFVGIYLIGSGAGSW